MEVQNNYYQQSYKADLFLADQTLIAKARLNFIKKVYIILSIQLLITVIITICSMYSPNFFHFQTDNPWLFWLLFSIMIFSEICMLCIPAGRKPPNNMILLFFFTIGQAYMVGYICSVVGQQNGNIIVLIAAVMTASIVIGLTIYAFLTKTDFTVRWGIVVVMAIALLFMGLFLIFSVSETAYVIYCALGVILFGIYLIIDTQLVIGNKRYGISMDDYAVGALILYIDIIQIFVYILQLLSRGK